MNRYFVKRTESDYADTQRIVAKDGHALKVRKFFVAELRKRKCNVERMNHFLGALRNLLKELGKRGYTAQVDAIRVTGGRLVKFEDLSRDQLFGRFASVQQAVAKWVRKAVETNNELWMNLVEKDLVFKANDAQAVMKLLFDLFDYNGFLAYDYEERGFDAFQQRMLSCVTK